MSLDIIAISPHPDDAELYCSGALLMMKRAGRRIGIVDLTRGELSTRGAPELRSKESAAASAVLGLDARVNVGIPDGDISNTFENRLALIRTIRALRPGTLLIPPRADRHPDHEHASALARDAAFAAGLEKVRTEIEGVPQRPHRPARIFAYMMTWDFQPPIIVDVSGAQERKMAAIRCYASQFHTGVDTEGPDTYISTPDFIEALVARSRRLGFLIGARYGEGYEPMQPLGLPVEMMMWDVTQRESDVLGK